jgi:hypothetical protein
MKLHRCDLSNILSELPRLEAFNPDQEIALFIVTLGFEDRTHQIIDQLAQKGMLKNTHILLIKYPTNSADNERNINYFNDAQPNEELLHELQYDRNTFQNSIKDKFDELNLPINSTVALDISTISSYVFFPTFFSLLLHDINLFVYYSEAETYFPNKEEWEEIEKKNVDENCLFPDAFENASFQSAGVEDIYPYSPFFEFNPGNRPSKLVAVPNFSCSRMSTIKTKDKEINKTSDEDIVWLIGMPPAENNRWRAEAVIKTNNLLNQSQKNIHYVCTLDYKEIINKMENIWLDNKYDYQFTIGTLGSKMQHLGVGIFLWLHKDIGMIMAEPKEFKASKFSEGYGATWQIKIGNTIKFRKILAKYQKFQWGLID